MPRLPPVVYLFAFFTCLTTGCQNHARPKPIGSATVTLDASTRRAPIGAKLAFEIALELPAPKARGHVWQIIQNDTRFLVPLSEASTPTTDTGVSVVRFHAVRQGRTLLKFAAVPEKSGSEAKPADVYEVIVTIE